MAENEKFTSGRKGDSELFLEERKSKKEYVVNSSRKTALDLMGFNGVDDSDESYLKIHDGGRDIYSCGLYIERLPRNLVIASSFTKLFRFHNTISNVFIVPLAEESISVVNKRLDMLEGEIRGAMKDIDGENRLRELQGKKDDVRMWATEIDSGKNTLYRVGFLFILLAFSRDELNIKISDFCGEAKGFEIMSCYGAQLEAFLSAFPINKLQTVRLFEKEPVGRGIIKMHTMDRKSLSTIFNHTDSVFNHKDGVPIGRDLYTGRLVCYDPYDKVHFSYGMLVAGVPGSGKSATMKELYSRLIDFGYHFALIDFEPHTNGRHGEYAPFTEAVGGVNYLFSSNSDKLINLYEINEETEYDINTDTEYRILRLNDKIIDTTSILLVLATGIQLKKRDAVFSAEMLVRMESVIRKAVKTIYTERGIRDGEPDSLYATDVLEGKFHSGRRRKKLPQQHDFYMQLLRDSKANMDKYKDEAYALLLDIFEDTVRELYYCPVCLKEYTKTEYESIKASADGHRRCMHADEKSAEIREVHGSKAYLDCESTISVDMETPVFNFDLSQIPESERPAMVLVAQNFIQEYFIKTNSSNPKKARKLLIGMDEAHKVLRYASAREFLDGWYRTARKKHVGPVLLMQSVADLGQYQDTENIISNTETFFLFKHGSADKEYIRKVTGITASQAEAIVNLGGGINNEVKNPGEFCLIERPTKKVCFVKADYLRNTEEMIVETDAEQIARIYERRGW